MKTKSIKSVILATVVTCLLFLTACTGSTTSIKKIEFLVSPKDVYDIALGENEVLATISVTYSDNSSQSASLRDAAGLGVKVTGNTFSQPGRFTLVASYGAIRASFEYAVINSNDVSSLFAGGKGTISEPYQISTAQQLSNIRYALSENYKLINDIDLDGIEWMPIGKVVQTVISAGKAEWNIEKFFTGTLDGDNKTIQNLTITDPNQKNAGLFAAIKGRIVDGNLARPVIENIDFKNVNIDVSPEAAATIAYTAGDADFVNITVDGSLRGRNLGGIVGSGCNLTFEDVDTTGVDYILTRHFTTENHPTNAANNAYYILCGGLAMQFQLNVDGAKDGWSAAASAAATKIIIKNCKTDMTRVTYDAEVVLSDSGIYFGLKDGYRSITSREATLKKVELTDGTTENISNYKTAWSNTTDKIMTTGYYLLIGKYSGQTSDHNWSSQYLLTEDNITVVLLASDKVGNSIISDFGTLNYCLKNEGGSIKLIISN